MVVHFDSLAQRYGGLHKPWQQHWTCWYKGDDVPGPRIWSCQDGVVNRHTYQGCTRPVTSTASPKQYLCDSRKPSSSTTVRNSPWLSADDVKVSRVAFPFGQSVLSLRSSQNGTCFRPEVHREGPRQGVKRRRALSDVDGPHTAGLGCKKRRLRRNLITSRLSKPFSMPASHIINRESVALGDRRSLKLTAILSARRIHSSMTTSGHPSSQANKAYYASPSSLLRRAAIVNRFRLGVLNGELERGSDLVNMLTKDNATLSERSRGAGPVVGARFPANPWPGSGPLIPGLRLPLSGQRVLPEPLSPETVLQRMPLGPPPPKVTVDTAVSPMPKVARSPRLKPVKSPLLRSPRPWDEEEYFDEEETAFPTMEYESRYESTEETDHVYADFGVIFGGGSADGHSDEEPDHYDDYMDELDGIPQTAR